MDYLPCVKGIIPKRWASAAVAIVFACCSPLASARSKLPEPTSTWATTEAINATLVARGIVSHPGGSNAAAKTVQVVNASCTGRGLSRGYSYARSPRYFQRFSCDVGASDGARYAIDITSVTNWGTSWTGGSLTLTKPAPYTPPAGFIVWTGDGTGSGNVAYQPSTCRTIFGVDLQNGQSDSHGAICFSYLVVTQNDCSYDLYVMANVVDPSGVTVGYTNALQPSVKAGQTVKMQSIVYGHPGSHVDLVKITCT
jgi:hypothetical protein